MRRSRRKDKRLVLRQSIVNKCQRMSTSCILAAQVDEEVVEGPVACFNHPHLSSLLTWKPDELNESPADPSCGRVTENRPRTATDEAICTASPTEQMAEMSLMKTCLLPLQIWGSDETPHHDNSSRINARKICTTFDEMESMQQNRHESKRRSAQAAKETCQTTSNPTRPCGYENSDH